MTGFGTWALSMRFRMVTLVRTDINDLKQNTKVFYNILNMKNIESHFKIKMKWVSAFCFKTFFLIQKFFVLNSLIAMAMKDLVAIE